MTIPYHTETWELDPSNNIFPVINGKILANKMFDCRLRRFFKSGLWVRFSNLFFWVLCDLKMNLYIISIGSHWKKTSTSMWGTPSEKDPKMKPWVGEKLDRKHLSRFGWHSPSVDRGSTKHGVEFPMGQGVHSANCDKWHDMHYMPLLLSTRAALFFENAPILS